MQKPDFVPFLTMPGLPTMFPESPAEDTPAETRSST